MNKWIKVLIASPFIAIFIWILVALVTCMGGPVYGQTVPSSPPDFPDDYIPIPTLTNGTVLIHRSNIVVNVIDTEYILCSNTVITVWTTDDLRTGKWYDMFQIRSKKPREFFKIVITDEK